MHGLMSGDGKRGYKLPRPSSTLLLIYNSQTIGLRGRKSDILAGFPWINYHAATGGGEWEKRKMMNLKGNIMS